MKSFRIEFIWDGSEYCKLFQAASVDAVIALIGRQYPGCHVWGIVEI